MRNSDVSPAVPLSRLSVVGVIHSNALLKTECRKSFAYCLRADLTVHDCRPTCVLNLPLTSFIKTLATTQAGRPTDRNDSDLVRELIDIPVGLIAIFK